MASKDVHDGAPEPTPGSAPERVPSVAPVDTARLGHADAELFRAVQTGELFADSKEFVDHVPSVDPETVTRRYREERDHPDFDLEAFVDEHFEGPPEVVSDAATDATTLEGHVEALWERLARPQVSANEHDTLVPLPNPHVVPGGRFRESYYWDSYFIAEGLAAQGRLDLVEDMIENVASLIDRFGFVPNGNRRYLLTRSQPPLFSELVSILVRERGIDAAREYLPRLEREYEFWMDGAAGIGSGTATQRVVSLDDGVLNRYWDGTAAPRPESYREDADLARTVPEEHRAKLYRDVRAACESGWDFSGRWLADPDSFASIRTTDLVPVDCNAFLFALEGRLATWFGALGDDERASRYRAAARRRASAIERYCWDETAGFYFDYDHVQGRRTGVWTLAAVAPLYVGLATDEQAAAVATALEERFLEDGGLLTTLQTTGEQWDAPNGWAPLQWMAIYGLRRYGYDDLATEIRERWLECNRTIFEEHGVLLEKYDVTPGGNAGGGGEYPLQLGFGWTNGVAAALLSRDDARTERGEART